MATSFVNVSTGALATGTSRATSHPAAIQAGDHLRLGILMTGNQSATVVTPTGWTARGSAQFNATDNATVAWFSRIWDGAAAAPTVTWGGASISTTFAMSASRGVDQGTPVEAETEKAVTAGTTSPTNNTITTLTDGSVVEWWVCNANGAAITVPAGFTSRLSDGAVSGFGIGDKAVTPAAATGTMTGTFSPSSDYYAAAFALKPAAPNVALHGAPLVML